MRHKSSQKKVKKGKKTSKNKVKNINYKIVLFCSAAIILSLSLFNLIFHSISANRHVPTTKIEIDTKKQLSEKKYFWETFLREHHTYLPGWLELAEIELQLENREGAIQALETARNINPNSDLYQEVANKLGLSGF